MCVCVRERERVGSESGVVVLVVVMSFVEVVVAVPWFVRVSGVGGGVGGPCVIIRLIAERASCCSTNR